jgi:hypothetical protein
MGYRRTFRACLAPPVELAKQTGLPDHVVGEAKQVVVDHLQEVAPVPHVVFGVGPWQANHPPRHLPGDHATTEPRSETSVRYALLIPKNSSNTSGPTTLADRALRAWHQEGLISIRFASGHEVSFPITGNLRLESAAEEDVGRIEISPFGLHWPTLDEDLSFEGILAGRCGQR